MTIQKFNPDIFVNEDFTMKVLILIHDIYTVGLITKIKDEDLLSKVRYYSSNLSSTL